MNTKAKTSDLHSAISKEAIVQPQPFRLAPGRLRAARDRMPSVNQTPTHNLHARSEDAWLRRTDDAMFANFYDPSC